MQKRLISMVLALSMALTAMPLPALAQRAPPGKRVTKVQVIRAWNRLKKLGLAK